METKEKCSLLIDRLYEKHILQKEEYLFLIENKEKFTQYLDEISSYKTKNSSYNHNKKKY